MVNAALCCANHVSRGLYNWNVPFIHHRSPPFPPYAGKQGGSSLSQLTFQTHLGQVSLPGSRKFQRDGDGSPKELSRNNFLTLERQQYLGEQSKALFARNVCRLR